MRADFRHHYEQFSGVQCDRVVEMIMTGGDICLLLPNRPPTFGDKVGQLRRRREALPRCLFGPPDPAETERLLKEELQRERERFQRRWNVDLDTIEADIEKRESATKRAKLSDLDLISKTSDSRLPQITTEVEERLSSPSHQEEDKPPRNTAGHVPTLKKTAVYRKPCSKFQKRVRVLGSYKRQTYITGNQHSHEMHLLK